MSTEHKKLQCLRQKSLLTEEKFRKSVISKYRYHLCMFGPLPKENDLWSLNVFHPALFIWPFQVVVRHFVFDYHLEAVNLTPSLLPVLSQLIKGQVNFYTN